MRMRARSQSRRWSTSSRSTPRSSRRTAGLGSYPRNPWTGVHAGREFLYDLGHPDLFRQRVLAGLRGEIPQVGKRQRLLSVGLMIVGGLNAFTGLAVIVRGAGWL
jgi:hypothetical protein